ncbi:hypothetical protein PVK06_009180 [Gossypium arboreum]|uniref:Uncharacterized protein n=1 Tax=Gossypium arboreum TaxID=29729 RepID=A0ABR0QMW0_GOSAR|nr:hypothetical protein PVK06_009180 [Gossypium arboreum]
MVQTHIDNVSPFLELYVELSRQDKRLATLTSLHVRETRMVENVDSLTTLLESSHYDILESSMGRHSSISALDFNRGRQNTKVSSFGGVSQDHPKLDSNMIAGIILPMVKVDSRTAVSILIANIRSQFNYTPSYSKAWIAKQKVLENMHNGWYTSYNEILKWSSHTTTITCSMDDEFSAIYFGPSSNALKHSNTATCINLSLDPMRFSDEVYKLEKLYNVLRHVFPPVPDEHKGPSVSLAPFKLLPNRRLHRKPKGQSTSTRIRDNMDIRDRSKQLRVVDGYALDSFLVQLSGRVVVSVAPLLCLRSIAILTFSVAIVHPPIYK